MCMPDILFPEFFFCILLTHIVLFHFNILVIFHLIGDNSWHKNFCDKQEVWLIWINLVIDYTTCHTYLNFK